MKNILFVCTGNTCRSPMAEAICQDMINQGVLDPNVFSCSSAGVYAFEGDQASTGAIAAMFDFGLDISKHRAKLLDHEMIIKSYLILTMTKAHKDMILEVFPGSGDKIFTLKEYVGYDDNNWDVLDPYGSEEQVYIDCAAELEEVLYQIPDML